MAKTSSYRQEIEMRLAAKQGWAWHSLTAAQRNKLESYSKDYCLYPVDINGTAIEVGDTIACAALADRSAIMVTGTVTDIDADKGIQISEQTRTYSEEVGRKVRFGFPNRIVVTKKANNNV